jgi:hypoxanthine phosphoribosyltransferase
MSTGERGNTAVEKLYISAQSLLEDSWQLGVNILKSGFHPNFIVGVWRGGTPVGIAVQELLDFYGVHTDHISIRTSSYSGKSRLEAPVRVHGLDYLINNINADDALLIVDDVYDTGLSVQGVIQTLTVKARRNTPQDIRIATPYFKPAKNRTEIIPHYYIHETDQWLVFPHEMDGMNRAELTRHKPRLMPFIEDMDKFYADRAVSEQS